jgi:hypothetical protein
MKVTPISPDVVIEEKFEPNQQVIEAVKDLLQLAEAGKLQTFAAIGLGPNDTCITSMSFRRGHNMFAMLGAVHVLADNYKERVKATL